MLRDLQSKSACRSWQRSRTTPFFNSRHVHAWPSPERMKSIAGHWAICKSHRVVDTTYSWVLGCFFAYAAVVDEHALSIPD